MRTPQQFRQALLSGEQGSRVETVDVALTGLRFPPNDLKHTLPQQLLVLEVARRLAARNTQIPADATSVFVGMGCDPEIARYSSRWRLDGWAERWEDEGKPVTDEWVEAAKAALIPGLEAAGVVGTMPNIPANRINAQLNYLGPSYTIAAEELSGIRALECAVDALQKGEIDAALVGAVDLSDEVVHQAAAARLLDIYRQEPGDAAVVLLLKRVEDAQRDGDTILAIVDEHLLARTAGRRAQSIAPRLGDRRARADRPIWPRPRRIGSAACGCGRALPARPREPRHRRRRQAARRASLAVDNVAHGQRARRCAWATRRSEVRLRQGRWQTPTTGSRCERDFSLRSK